MKRNLGRTDRSIRLAAAVVVAILYLAGAVEGTLGLILVVVGLAMLLTAATGFCSLYVPFGIDTRKCPEQEQ
ncbi:MAG: DUF2892 domain-containing protein [Candidatus Fermentibacteraceae bacterium]